MWSDLPRDSSHLQSATDAKTKALLLSKQFDVVGTDQARLDIAKQLFAIYRLAGRADLARSLLNRLAKLGLVNHASPAWLVRRAWALADFWWLPLRSSGIALRRPRAPDAIWLRRCFADATFGQAVNRSYAERLINITDVELERELERQWRASPPDFGAQLMLIENAAGDRLGVAAMVNIDADNRRAEFLMGFQQPHVQSVAVLRVGGLMMDFAFRLANFHKLSASIYADNTRGEAILRMLESVGFKREGLLRDHLALPNGQYVDVHLVGGLGSEVLAQSRAIKYFNWMGVGLR